MGYDPQPDYYEILGVTQDEITRAFRKTLHAVHPDASGTPGLFRLVKTAYDTLSDPPSRAAYDLGPASASPPPKPDREPPPGAEPSAGAEPPPERDAEPPLQPEVTAKLRAATADLPLLAAKPDEVEVRQAQPVSGTPAA